MKAYRIQNDIVAARDEQEAIAAWSADRGAPDASAGPVEAIDPITTEVQIEDEDGSFRPGTIAEVLPIDGPAGIIAYGDCEDCG